MTTGEKQDRFMELFEPCKNDLVRFARAMTRDPEKTKDLVQETILKAFDKFESLRDNKAFKGFLFSIASRIYKRQIFRARLFFSFKTLDDHDNKFDGLISAEPQPDRRYDVEVLQKALLRLPDKQREAIALFEISGLSISEIREIQGGSVSGVKSRIQRARKELADIIHSGSRQRLDSAGDVKLKDEVPVIFPVLTRKVSL